MKYCAVQSPTLPVSACFFSMQPLQVRCVRPRPCLVCVHGRSTCVSKRKLWTTWLSEASRYNSFIPEVFPLRTAVDVRTDLSRIRGMCLVWMARSAATSRRTTLSRKTLLRRRRALDQVEISKRYIQLGMSKQFNILGESECSKKCYHSLVFHFCFGGSGAEHHARRLLPPYGVLRHVRFFSELMNWAGAPKYSKTKARKGCPLHAKAVYRGKNKED